MAISNDIGLSPLSPNLYFWDYTESTSTLMYLGFNCSSANTNYRINNFISLQVCSFDKNSYGDKPVWYNITTESRTTTIEPFAFIKITDSSEIP